MAGTPSATSDNSSVTPTAQAIKSWAIAGGPAPDPPPPPHGVRIDPTADSHDFGVLQRDLGPDFVIAHGLSDRAVRPGSAAGVGLPNGVDVQLSISSWLAYDGPASKTVCLPGGPRSGTCTSRLLANGKHVLVQKPAQVSGNNQPSVSVYFVRAHGVGVQINLTTRDSGTSGSSDKIATSKWVESMINRLGTAAADPRMEPWFLQAVRPS